VNQEGKSSGGGYGMTPLMMAAYEEHFQIVKYLIEQGEADPNIANSNGSNALHEAAWYNKKNTKLIELLLTNMSLDDSINKKWDGDGETPLDQAYS
jgi:ankyrin repeat protein